MKSLEEMQERAQTCFEKSDFESAREASEKWVKNYPESLAGYLMLSEVQAALGSPKSSIAALEEAIKQCQEPEKVDLALPLIARLLELDPLREDIYQTRIDLLFASGRTDEAIAYSRQLAQHFLQEDRGEAGIKLLVRCFQLKPNDIELILVLAEAYFTNGQLREATGMFRHALPHHIEAQNFEAATNILRRLTVVNPQDQQTFMELGDLYLKLERLNEAEQQFRSVLRQDLSNREALLKVADVCTRKAQFRDATMVYQRLLTVHKDDVEAHFGLGQIYQQQGMASDAIKHLLMAGLACVDDNKERARICFEAVLKLDPANTMAARQIQVLV